jgi:hypothetical protein
MFEENPIRATQVQAVYDLTKNLNRGAILLHEEIAQVLCLRPHEAHYDFVVERARKKLLEERGIETWPIWGVGYRLLTVAETITQLPIWRAEKQLTQVRKTRAALEALEVEGLSVHEHRLRTIQIDAAKEAKKDLIQKRKLLELLYGRAVKEGDEAGAPAATE